MRRILRVVTSLACGIMFGFGLSLSGMLDPLRVRGFLDIFGAWDPSLAFVLGGAVLTSFVGIRISRLLATPLLADCYDLPTKTRIDARLIAGSALFGIGWGLSGLCPGPAVASLTLGLVPIVAFTGAMLSGMAIFSIGMARRQGS